jgi:hypothetical protein
MPNLRDAVVRLGDLNARDEAVRLLVQAGVSATPFLRDGLTHPHWRVRHMSCRLLDDRRLCPDLLEQLRGVALSDPNKRVRRQAWHAVTCEPCKPDGADLSCRGGPLDAIAAELRDRSLRVRRGGASGLMFAAFADDPDVDRINPLIKHVLETESDETMVRRARRARQALESHRAPGS